MEIQTNSGPEREFSDKGVAAKRGNAFQFTIDGDRFERPSRTIVGGEIRKLGHVPLDREIYLQGLAGTES